MKRPLESLSCKQKRFIALSFLIVLSLLEFSTSFRAFLEVPSMQIDPGSNYHRTPLLFRCSRGAPVTHTSAFPAKLSLGTAHLSSLRCSRLFGSAVLSLPFFFINYGIWMENKHKGSIVKSQTGVFKLRNGGAVQVNNSVQAPNIPKPKPEDS